MAALKMGLTMKLWCGFNVSPYAARNETESSSEGLEVLWRKAWAVKSRPLGKGVSSAKEGIR